MNAPLAEFRTGELEAYASARAAQRRSTGATSLEDDSDRELDLEKEEGQRFGAAPGAGDCAAGENGDARRLWLDSFKLLKVLGRGSFGKVFLVQEKETQEVYAMKVLAKARVIRGEQVAHTRTERNILGQIRHPFIVGLHAAFHTRERLFFVLDYCPGGELYFHLGRHGRFAEIRARYYAAEITCALAHLHSLNIVYRDLKPENILLDAEGHVRLADFGLSKEGVDSHAEGANSFCGTAEYLAPEVVEKQGYGTAVDWWGLGVVFYEMLTGVPPFHSGDRRLLFAKIRSAEVRFPAYLKSRARDLIGGLLQRDPHERLGGGPRDAEDVKGHDIFFGMNWEKLERREVPPPWEPKIDSDHDVSLFDSEFTDIPIMSVDGDIGPRKASRADLDDFAGFTFNSEGVMDAPREEPSSPSSDRTSNDVDFEAEDVATDLDGVDTSGVGLALQEAA